MKAKKITVQLMRWYEKNARAMPWRIPYHAKKPSSRPNPYHILVSEIMLQQTRVDTVKNYYPKFLKRFPDIKALGNARISSVLKLWEGMGYYRRASALHATAKTIIKEHQGKIPGDPLLFKTLPGIGDYTCAAVCSIAYGMPLPVIDGNVIRVVTRFTEERQNPALTRTRKKIKKFLEDIIPPKNPGDFNQAVMELGATCCLPKKPHCFRCPWKKNCAAEKTGKQESFPNIPAKKAIPKKNFVTAFIQNPEGKILLGQRKEKILLGGLWEFPTFEIPANARNKKQHFKKSLPVSCTLSKKSKAFSHRFTHFQSLSLCYQGKTRRIRPPAEKNSTHDFSPYQTLNFFTKNKISKIALTKMSHKILSSSIASGLSL